MSCPNCGEQAIAEPSLFESNYGAKMRNAYSYRCGECCHEWMTNKKGTKILTINEGVDVRL